MISIQIPENIQAFNNLLAEIPENNYSVSKVKGIGSYQEIIDVTLKIIPAVVPLIKLALKELEKEKEISIKINGKEMKNLSQAEIMKKLNEYFEGK